MSDELTDHQVKLAAAVQCIYIANDWKRGNISTEEARTRLLDWDTPELKNAPNRLEFWALEETSE